MKFGLAGLMLLRTMSGLDRSSIKLLHRCLQGRQMENGQGLNLELIYMAIIGHACLLFFNYFFNFFI